MNPLTLGSMVNGEPSLLSYRKVASKPVNFRHGKRKMPQKAIKGVLCRFMQSILGTDGLAKPPSCTEDQGLIESDSSDVFETRPP
jgi:hypothetical protein